MIESAAQTQYDNEVDFPLPHDEAIYQEARKRYIEHRIEHHLNSPEDSDLDVLVCESYDLLNFIKNFPENMDQAGYNLWACVRLQARLLAHDDADSESYATIMSFIGE